MKTTNESRYEMYLRAYEGRGYQPSQWGGDEDGYRWQRMHRPSDGRAVVVELLPAE